MNIRRYFAPAILLLAAAQLAGCVQSPMLRYEPSAPAQVMSMIGASDVVDERARFRQIFCGVLERTPDRLRRPCDALLHRLVDEPQALSQVPLPAHKPDLRVVFVAGLFGGCRTLVSQPFEASLKPLASLGYSANLLRITGDVGIENNVQRLAEILSKEPDHLRRVVLVGHSQGAFDILEFLAAYPDLGSKVAAVVSIAGAINGSALADVYTNRYKSVASRLPLPQCIENELRVVDGLQYSTRLDTLRTYVLPAEIRFFSLVAFTSVQEISAPLRPFAAALAHIDPRNDGQLLHFDQIIPGSMLIGYVNADHWSVATPIEERQPAVATLITGHNYFPRAALMEAILLHVGESLERDRRGK